MSQGGGTPRSPIFHSPKQTRSQAGAPLLPPSLLGPSQPGLVPLLPVSGESRPQPVRPGRAPGTRPASGSLYIQKAPHRLLCASMRSTGGQAPRLGRATPSSRGGTLGFPQPHPRARRVHLRRRTKEDELHRALGLHPTSPRGRQRSLQVPSSGEPPSWLGGARVEGLSAPHPHLTGTRGSQRQHGLGSATHRAEAGLERGTGRLPWGQTSEPKVPLRLGEGMSSGASAGSLGPLGIAPTVALPVWEI